jgi:excinuclease ABC subunit C
MFDSKGAILYVGKAKNLRNRVSSYFRSRGLNNKTVALVGKIASIEVTITRTEAEALLLEQNLIKGFRPPYNILLRDDKSYPYIHLSSGSPFPRLSFYRGSAKGPGSFFGPYPSSGAVKESLNLLQKIFKVRQCEDSYFKNRSRPCLQYQINRCSGPCVNKVSEEQYKEDVSHTVMFLQGKSRALTSDISKKMEAASEQLDFEKAAEYRDQLLALQAVQQTQYIESGNGDVDVFAYFEAAGKACVQVVFVRAGRVLGSRSFFPALSASVVEDEGDENPTLSEFVSQFYLSSTKEIPKEIVLSHVIVDQSVLEEVLSDKKASKVVISTSVRTNRQQWLNLAVRTAEQNLISRLSERKNVQQRYRELQRVLELEAPPARMECFDISHSHGESTVASCVVFDQNGPLKSDYRKFNITGITPGDDYAAMRQALSRRYARVKASGAQLPDILFIDGGKGQVRQAVEVLQELDIAEVAIIGVSKGPERKAGEETLVFPPDYREQDLPATSAALHLIQHIRDESHRFAITGHKAKRDKTRRTSTLESIPGVGAKRRRELLRHFGGLPEVKAASLEDLEKVPGINKKLALQIYESFR